MNLENLKELLHYNPETGIFTHAKNRRKCKAGNRAGSPSGGYRNIRIMGRMYKEHRVAWLYMTGEWPTLHIDHINRIKSDNRFANLRDVTRSDNAFNTPLRPDNKTGIKGVYWRKDAQWWAVKLGDRHIGRSRDFFQACCIRKSAELI